MQRRDKIILDKIIDEVNIVTKMLSDVKQEDFVSDDILKRAAAMSVICFAVIFIAVVLIYIIGNRYVYYAVD